MKSTILYAIIALCVFASCASAQLVTLGGTDPIRGANYPLNNNFAWLTSHLYDRPVSATAPSAGQVYAWSSAGSQWQPTTIDTSLVGEAGNLYFTTARARGILIGSGPISYNANTGVVDCPTCLLSSGTYSNPTWLSLTATGGSISGLGGAALLSVGTGSGDVAAGNHTHTGLYQPVITTGTTSQYFRGDLSLATFPTTWAWSALSGVPSFATVATSGAKADVGLGSVENTALSTWPGSANLTTLGTIGTGLWHGTAIGDSYISSADAWNAKQAAISGAPGTWPSFGGAALLNVGTGAGDVAAGNAKPATAGAADTAAALAANQGTTTTVLHGAASGTPGFAAVTPSDFGVQNANKVLAGPVTGADATPTYRALVSADIPSNAANTSGKATTAGTADTVTSISAHASTELSDGSTLRPFTRTGTVISPTNAGDSVAIGTTLQLPASTSAMVGPIYVGDEVFLHDYADPSAIGSGRNTFIGIVNGNFTMGPTAIANTGVGASVLGALTTGYDNTAMGVYALTSNTTGYQNTSVGEDVMAINTTGNNNSALGTGALYTNLSGSTNTAVGEGAAYSQTIADNNVAVGAAASYFNLTGAANVAVGTFAGEGVSGQSYHDNVLMGYAAGYGISTGSNNTVLGSAAGQGITTGSGNILIGAGINVPSGSQSNYINIGNTIYGDISSSFVSLRYALQLNAPGGTPQVTAQPSCDAGTAGTIWYSGHTAGVKDSAAICAADGSNVWAWRAIY